MPAIGIQSGQQFTATCETSLANLGASYSNHRVYYKKPNGDVAYVTPTVSGTTLIATITLAINSLTDWGMWEFQPYCEGSGSIPFRGDVDTLKVDKSLGG